MRQADRRSSSGARHHTGRSSRRWRRAAAADGDVLRPGRLDGAVGAARPGGSARGHRRLSPLRCQGDRPRRRLCRQVHGRRGAGLFRLSAGRRARCRARGAGRARAGREGGRARHRRGGAIAGAGRDRHRPCCRRRSRRLGRSAGTRGRWRDAEPRGAAAGTRRAGYRGDRAEHPAADRRSVRVRGSGCRRAQGPGRAGHGLAGATQQRRREPLRGIARARADPARRPRRGAGAIAAPLATGQGRRGPGGRADRRTRHRQIASGAGNAGAAGGRAAHEAALFLLAAPSGERAPSLHYPARARRGLQPRRHAGSAAGQARNLARPVERRRRGDRVHRRADVDPDRRQIPSPGPHPAAAQGEDVRGAAGADGAAGGAAAGIDAVRGRALDRPDLARAVDPDRGAGIATAVAAPRHRAAGVHLALARRRARHDTAARPPRPPRGHDAGRAVGRRQGAAGRDPRADPRPHRRRAAVRRGADQDDYRKRPLARGRRALRARRRAAAAGDPDHPARTR